MPHSRVNDIDEKLLEQAGYTILSRLSERPVVDAFAKTVGRSAFLMLQGHQDYPTERLLHEYRAAQQRGDDPAVPVNYDLERPVNRWRSNSRALLAAWLHLAMERKRALDGAKGFDAATLHGAVRHAM